MTDKEKLDRYWKIVDLAVWYLKESAAHPCACHKADGRAKALQRMWTKITEADKVGKSADEECPYKCAECVGVPDCYVYKKSPEGCDRKCAECSVEKLCTASTLPVEHP